MLSDGRDVAQKRWGESKTQLIWEKGSLATSWPLILKLLKVCEASFDSWGHVQTPSNQESDEVSRSTCFTWMDLNRIINSRGKNDWHMLCWERREISLTVPLVHDYHDLDGRIFDRWILRQKGMKNPLKWHNQPGKKRMCDTKIGMLARWKSISSWPLTV